MATPQEYLLSFDFTVFTTQFSNLNKAFTDFGDTIQKLANQVSTDLKGIQEQATALMQVLNTAGMASETGFQNFEKHVKATSGYLEDYQKKSSEIAQKLKDISNTDISKISQAAGGKETAHDRIEDVIPGGVEGVKGEESDELSKEMEKKAEETKSLAQKLEALDEKFAGLDKKLEEAFKTVYDVAKKEASQAKSKATSIASQLTGGLISGGGLIGMALGFAILGYKEKDRIRAEAGEMFNVFEAGTSNFFDKTTKNASNWFSSFAEKAQRYYGIGRQEVQATVKAMIDAGYTTEQIMAKFDKKLGEVGSNVSTLTIGIDKHFNMATGTSAKNVNTLVSNYGDSLEEAADKYTKLAFAAQRSGMGVSKFIDSIMSGSQALTQYGIDLNDVANVMQTLKKHYQDMGLDKQYAGGQASEALSGISQGIAGFGIGMQAIVSQRMFKGVGALEARQKFMEGWGRVAKGEDKGFLIEAVQQAVGHAKEQTGGGREESILYLQNQGFTFQAATAAVDVADKLEKGATIQDLNTKEVKALRESFLTEGKAVSEQLKNQRQLIDALAELGKGVLKILGGILGALVTGFKFLVSLPQLMSMTSDKRDVELEKVKASFSAQWGAIKSGMGEVVSGGAKAGGVFGDILNDVFGQDSSLGKALDLQIGEQWTVKQVKDDVLELKNNQTMQAKWLYTIQKDMQEGFASIIGALPGASGLADKIRDLSALTNLGTEAYIASKMAGGGEAGKRAAQKVVSAAKHKRQEKLEVKGKLRGEHIAASVNKVDQKQQ